MGQGTGTGEGGWATQFSSRHAQAVSLSGWVRLHERPHTWYGRCVTHGMLRLASERRQGWVLP